MTQEKVLHHIEKSSGTSAKVTFTVPLQGIHETYEISKVGKEWECVQSSSYSSVDQHGQVQVLGSVVIGHYKALTLMGVIRQIKDQITHTRGL